MNCEFTEKISPLIDGELKPEEEKIVLAHLSGCESCRQTREDFLRLGQHVKAYDSTPDPVTQQRALRESLASEKNLWWQRKITLPAPAFALLVVALLALTVLIVAMRAGQRRQPGTGESIKSEAGRPGATESPEGAIDFSRYDGGGRALIYKTRREHPEVIRQ